MLGNSNILYTSELKKRTTSLTLYNNVLYGIVTFRDAMQKFPQGDPLDVPINYLHLPPKIGDNVFLSTNLDEMKEKCPKAFSSGLLMDQEWLYNLLPRN